MERREEGKGGGVEDDELPAGNPAYGRAFSVPTTPAERQGVGGAVRRAAQTLWVRSPTASLERASLQVHKQLAAKWLQDLRSAQLERQVGSLGASAKELLDERLREMKNNKPITGGR